MSMGTGMGRDGDATTGAMGATAHGGDGLDGREAARGAGAPAGAFGPPVLSARIRTVPEDFRVEELDAFEASGFESALTRGRKTSETTAAPAMIAPITAYTRGHDCH